MAELGLGYLGRIVGVGMYKDKPFAVYGVTGRSDPSKERKAEIIEHDGIVRIGPSGKITPKQRKMGDLIFYNAMMIFEDPRVIVVSNGKQTEPTKRALVNNVEKYPHAIAEGFVKMGGAEPDKLRTPRVTGILDSSANAALGIVTDGGICSQLIDVHEGGACHFKYVSTYLGSCGGAFGPRDHKNSGVRVPTGRLDISPRVSETPVDLYGETSQALADNLYDFLPSDLRVSTAAAMWDPDINIWRLAKRNLHE